MPTETPDCYVWLGYNTLHRKIQANTAVLNLDQIMPIPSQSRGPSALVVEALSVPLLGVSTLNRDLPCG